MSIVQARTKVDDYSHNYFQFNIVNVVILILQICFKQLIEVFAPNYLSY